MAEVSRRLWPAFAEQASLYLPGRSLTFTRARSLDTGYQPDEIKITEVTTPRSTGLMNTIRDKRYNKLFPNGVARNGELVGSSGPILHGSCMLVPIYHTCFLDWRLTLPWGDEYDPVIEPNAMRQPINLHHACITRDQQLLYVRRGGNRASHNDKILGLHSWGYDIDRDGVQKALTWDLRRNHGYGIYKQAQLAVLREFNPPEKQILLPHEINVQLVTGATLHLQPYDFSWHLCTLVDINRDAGELLEERRNYPMPAERGGRIAEYLSWAFTADAMRTFFRTHKDNLATTTEPALLLACTRHFGVNFVKKIGYRAKTELPRS